MQNPPSSAPGTSVVLGSTLIRLEGADALDLLHRISTQSLSDLAAGQLRATLFCDFRGRLLHRAVVAVTEDHTVWLLRDDAPAGELMAFIDRQIFREDVRMSEGAAGQVVRPVAGGLGLPAGSLVEEEGTPRRLQTTDGFGLHVEPGAAAPSDPDSERRRIEAGRPRHGHEIRDAFNPFEVGLAHEIHLSKGCFTGQEALMRMVTYRGVRRRLARVRGRDAPPPVPAEIHRGKDRVGIVTSAAAEDAGWTGLAVIDRRALTQAAPLEVEGIGAVEPPQPFPETEPSGLP